MQQTRRMVVQMLCECVEHFAPSAVEVLERNVNAVVCMGTLCADSFDDLLPMTRPSRTDLSGLWVTMAIGALMTFLALRRRNDGRTDGRSTAIKVIAAAPTAVEPTPDSVCGPP